MPLDFGLPRLSLRFTAVWLRNALVWRKIACASLLANLGDPLIYLLALGYGLGALIPDVAGVPYITFLAAGSIAFSTMNTATFESFYSAFSRMHVPKTWDAIMNAPLDLDDIVLAEAVFSASKAFISGAAILLIAALLGLVESPAALLILPVLPIVGLCFASLGLMITALARMYDFFTYYFTLVLTPMAMMSGIFFPIEQLPAAMQAIAQLLPLAHAVQVIRPYCWANFRRTHCCHWPCCLPIRWWDSSPPWCCSDVV